MLPLKLGVHCQCLKKATTQIFTPVLRHTVQSGVCLSNNSCSGVKSYKILYKHAVLLHGLSQKAKETGHNTHFWREIFAIEIAGKETITLNKHLPLDTNTCPFFETSEIVLWGALIQRTTILYHSSDVGVVLKKILNRELENAFLHKTTRSTPYMTNPLTQQNKHVDLFTMRKPMHSYC